MTTIEDLPAEIIHKILDLALHHPPPQAEPETCIDYISKETRNIRHELDHIKCVTDLISTNKRILSLMRPVLWNFRTTTIAECEDWRNRLQIVRERCIANPQDGSDYASFREYLIFAQRLNGFKEKKRLLESEIQRVDRAIRVVQGKSA